MKTTAVLVARFQTPELHEGHIRLLDQITSRHRRTIVVLGVSPAKGSRRNPFDFHTREKMLKARYPQLVVLPLRDHRSDEHWSANLDRLLDDSFPGESFLLYGGRDSFIPAYSGAFPVSELPEVPGHSSTQIRDQRSDEVLGSEDFRLGVNYACQNRYPTVFPAVDLALIREGAVLLGRKPGESHWRFPGGFIDPTDASAEQAARRELREECGDLEVERLTYLGSFLIDDWRYRGEADKIMSFFFAAQFLYGTSAAGDDLEAVQWWSFDKLEDLVQNGLLTPEHLPLAGALLEHIQLQFQSK